MIPVIPTVAEITDMLVSETGVDVIVTARLRVVTGRPPRLPPLVSGTPLQACQSDDGNNDNQLN